MHNGDWNNGMDSGNWSWIPMMIMMFAIVGGLIWIGIALTRRTNHSLHAAAAAPVTASSTPAAAPTAQEILAQRLARGEIEPDDYRQRLDALTHSPGT